MGDLLSDKLDEMVAAEERRISPRPPSLSRFTDGRRDVSISTFDPRTGYTYWGTMSSKTGRVLRTTMFRIADPANQQKLIEAYHKMSAEQEKDGKPYILYMSAGAAVDPARSRGYTVLSRTEFASMEDMRWYEEHCPAHKALRATSATLGMQEPPLVFYHQDEPLVDRRDSPAA